MTPTEARRLVVDAGRRLYEAGLVARTWGNVSCRIDGDRFAITPSGREYLTLTPEDIVEVAVADCSWSGPVKPSSEKGIHAEVYGLHPGINFVIHTHQDDASVVSVLGLGSMETGVESVFRGKEIVCAAYALPGTKTLRRNVAEALGKSAANAVIMKNHGALCFGSDPDETFDTALALESECGNFLRSRFGREHAGSPDYSDRAARGSVNRVPGRSGADKAFAEGTRCESERTADGFILRDGTTERAVEISAGTGASADETANLHGGIFGKLKNVRFIIHSRTPYVLAASSMGMNLRPLLDDFAQIAGTSVRTVEKSVRGAVAALKRASAVFIEGDGALCCGATRSDAEAVAAIMEKNCKAFAAAAPFGKVEFLGGVDCILMRFVYKRKYSKLAART